MQPTPDPSPILPIVEPLALDLPSNYTTSQVAVSADGSTAYAVVLVPAVDIGALVDRTIHFWLTPIAAISLVLAIGRLVRVRASPERVGERHCRACGYNVNGVTEAAKCPECGIGFDKRRPRIGRRTWRRIAVPTVVILAAIIGCVAFWTLRGTPRKIFRSLDLLSPWAMKVLEADGWLVPASWTARQKSYLAIDSATGGHRAFRHGRENGIAAIAALGNDEVVLVDDDAFVFVDGKRGKTGKTLKLPGFVPLVFDGWDPNSSLPGECLVQFETAPNSPGTNNGRLVAWSPVAGTWRVLVETPWDPTPNTTSGWHGFLRVPGEQTARYMDFVIAAKGAVHTYELRWFDEKGGLLGKTVIPRATASRINAKAPWFNQDGTEMYLTVHQQSARHRFKTAQLIAAAKAGEEPEFRVQQIPLRRSLAEQTGWAVERLDDELLIRKCTTNEIHARLALQIDTNPLQTVVSPDGSCVAVVAFRFPKKVRIVTPPKVFVWRIPAE